MWIAGRCGAGYHPNTRIELSHTSSMHRVSRNEVRVTLFSPKAFQVGTGRNSGIGGLRHAGEVADENAVGKTKSKRDVARVRIQCWMLTFRLQSPSLIKERSSRPPDQNPLITQHSHLIGPLNSPVLPIPLLTSQGLPSCFGSVCSHDPHRLLLYPVCRYCSLFVILVRQPTSSPIFV